MVKRKRTNNDLQSIAQKTKDRATQMPLKTGYAFMCSGRESNYSSLLHIDCMDFSLLM